MWLQGLISSMTLLLITACNLDRKGASAEDFPQPAPLKDTVGIKLIQGFSGSVSDPTPEPAVADTLDSTSQGKAIKTPPGQDSLSAMAAVAPSAAPFASKQKPGNQKTVPQGKARTGKPAPVSQAASPSFWSMPKTLEEANTLAQQHCRGARYFLTEAPDTAMKHVLFALNLYENGSLFSLKARLHLNAGQFPEAVNAAERSIALDDHWYRKDLLGAYEVRARALKALAEKFPSEDAQLKANQALATFMVMQNEIHR